MKTKGKLFISELHDIGKLVDWDAPDLKGKIKPCSPRHTFHNFDFSQLGMPSPPSSPSWWGQFSGEVRSLYPNKEVKDASKDYISDIFLTKIADELAASISRTWGKKGSVAEGLYVLWNPGFYQKEVKMGEKWAAFTTLDELKEMFLFIDNCNNTEEFFEKYGENLKLTAEDKSAPLNIIDLLTHLELTGKIYRVLKKHSRFDQQRNKLIYGSDEIQQVNEAAGGRIDEPKQKGKWIYRLIFCRIYFSQSLIRLQDLNIFKKRADLIKNFSEDASTKDYVLFFTDDFMALFIPKEEEFKIQELLKPFLKSGFLIDYKEMEAELNLLTSSMERAYQRFHSSSTNRHLKLYDRYANLDLLEELQPPLCDSCQMTQGKERVKEQIREYLCDTCYEIRDMGEPASEYADWEEKAAWMKITLDQDHLLRVIQKLFEEYVDTHPTMQGVNISDKTTLRESFRPLAVQIDFIKDYKLLLKAFNEKTYEIEGNDGTQFFTKETFLYPIDGYYEFGIFKAYSGKDILKVLDLFYNLLEKYFPECLRDSPIKLSLSLAHVKYPYHEHWQFLSMPEEAINIQCPGSARFNINITQYKLLREKIRKEDVKLSHFLHRLANIEVETKSNMTVMLEILDNRKKFPALLELIQKGLWARQILDFYKITAEEIIYGNAR